MMRLFKSICFFSMLGFALLASANNAYKNKLPIKLMEIDGIHVAKSGTVLAASGFRGDYILAIRPDGTSFIFVEGLNGPIDIAEDSQGNFYTTNFNNGTVTKIDRLGNMSLFAEVADGPAGIVIDEADNVFVAHYGDFSGNGNSVSKISPTGEVSIFSEGGYLQAPVGLTFDDEGYLYAANFNEGSIISIDQQGVQEVVAQVPSEQGFAIGHLTFANKRIIATSPIDQKLYIVSRRGQLREFRAKVDQSRFPNGLTYDPITNRVYFTYAFGPVASLDFVQLKSRR